MSHFGRVLWGRFLVWGVFVCLLLGFGVLFFWGFVCLFFRGKDLWVGVSMCGRFVWGLGLWLWGFWRGWGFVVFFLMQNCPLKLQAQTETHEDY